VLDLLTDLMAAAEGRCTYADARWVATDGEDLAVVGGRIDDVAAMGSEGIGVRVRDCKRGDSRCVVAIANRAGVREAIFARAHGTDDDAQRAEGAGGRGAGDTYAHRLAIAAAVLRALHAVGEKHDAILHRARRQRIQRGNVAHHHGLGLDAFRARAYAAAQCKHRHGLRPG